MDPLPRSARIDNTNDPTFNFCQTLWPSPAYANLLLSQLTVRAEVIDADIFTDETIGSVNLPIPTPGRTSRSIGSSASIPSAACVSNYPCLDLSVAVLEPPSDTARSRA